MAFFGAADAVFDPDVFRDRLREREIALSRIFRSQIVESNEMLSSALRGESDKFEIPYWGMLAGKVPTLPASGVDVVAKKPAMDKLTARRNIRVEAWGRDDFSMVSMGGADALDVVIDKMADYWADYYQRTVMSCVKGCLAGTDGSDLIVDITTASTSTVNSVSMLDLLYVMGDHADEVAGYMMHSQVVKQLEVNGLVTTIPDYDQKTLIKTYGGKPIIVDDNYTSYQETVSSTTKTVYYTIAFKRGGFAYADAPSVFEAPIELYREPGKGIGRTTLYDRKCFWFHPLGFSYKGTPGATYPSDVELATGANWERKFDVKNCGFAVLRSL